MRAVAEPVVTAEAEQGDLHVTKQTAVIVGAGHRAVLYASYAEDHPEELAIVGVADPSELRRRQAADRFDLPPDHCFQSAEQLARAPKLADFVINGTMDHQHVPTTLPLLERGYDVLLEKPFATNEAEMWELLRAVHRNGCRVAICHVLRHAPFYIAADDYVAGGAIGEIINVQATEHVSYHHMAVGYVRGKWRREDACHSTMLMAKCCHDLDLIAWFKKGIPPVRVASSGSNFQFRPEKAPANAGTRCLVDCPVESDCLYSARKHHLDHPDRWSFYVWDSLEHLDNPTEEDRIEVLKTTNYGRCAWKTDMDVVDHQSVLVEFADGSTATLNMVGGASKPSRSLHILGTEGELQGRLEDSRFVIRRIDPRPGHEYSEEEVDVNVHGDMTGARGGHGGGDMRLVADFLRFQRGEETSPSTTSIDDSINGHLVGFCADRARRAGEVVTIQYPEI